jgi:hypothetical protein
LCRKTNCPTFAPVPFDITAPDLERLMKDLVMDAKGAGGKP